MVHIGFFIVFRRFNPHIFIYMTLSTLFMPYPIHIHPDIAAILYEKWSLRKETPFYYSMTEYPLCIMQEG